VPSETSCEQFFVDANEDDDDEDEDEEDDEDELVDDEDELVIDPPELDFVVTEVVVAATEVVAGLPDLLLPPQPAAATARTRIEANADVCLMPAPLSNVEVNLLARGAAV
jgi:hypothetical protein